MTYSVDLRKKVVAFVHDGGSQAEAARRFEVSLWCVQDWQARKTCGPGGGVAVSGSWTWTGYWRRFANLDIPLRERGDFVEWIAAWSARQQKKMKIAQKRPSSIKSAIQKSG